MDGSAARKRHWLWTAVGCVTAPLLALILMSAVLRTTFDRYRQVGRDMEPTVSTGDLVLVRPARGIKRGDLIAFTTPVTKGVLLKRVIALPGDVIELRDNKAMLNGLLLTEPYTAPNDTSLPDDAVFRDMPPLTVEPNAYFVLGDNRDYSNDSRFIGTVDRQAVRGRVVFVISPKNGMWRP